MASAPCQRLPYRRLPPDEFIFRKVPPRLINRLACGENGLLLLRAEDGAVEGAGNSTGNSSGIDVASGLVADSSNHA